MAKKRRERFKDRNKDQPKAEPAPTVEALKRRRNRRLIFVGLMALSFPILEVVAYRFRAITMTVSNRSEHVITRLKVIFPGGSIEAPEVKPGGSITRVTRPDFSFQGSHFSTYPIEIQFATDHGGFFRQTGGRAGALDYSAHETFTIEPNPFGTSVQVMHSTSPGFPLSLIRDLLARLGIG